MGLPLWRPHHQMPVYPRTSRFGLNEPGMDPKVLGLGLLLNTPRDGKIENLARYRIT